MGRLPSAEEIEGILKKVKDPETGMSVLDLALVKHIDYREDTETLIIKCDFLRRNPSCVGCLPIAWFVQKAIMDGLSEEFLKFEGVKDIEFLF